MKKIYLVACGSRKLSCRARARDLYKGELFKRSRALAERRADFWFVLSAKHGLLDPDRIVDPYDETLAKKGKILRQYWAAGVEIQLRERLGLEYPAADPDLRIVVLAGEDYRELLIPKLQAIAGAGVTVPLAGLGIGEQLKALGKALREDGWTRISLNACAKGTYRSADGWTIEHCGHPTALFPYMVYDPDGEPRFAENGWAHQNLAAAKAAVERFRLEGSRERRAA